MQERPCDHDWIVSVYSFYKETVSKSEPGPTIAKDFARYQTSRTHIDVVEADAKEADGLRATELMCALCGQQRRVQWPSARTEVALGTGLPPIEPG